MIRNQRSDVLVLCYGLASYRLRSQQLPQQVDKFDLLHGSPPFRPIGLSIH